ncbi:hypothetical protein PFTANZ_05818, partial [Plasmodium falciparum Tanzania (2000708)]
MSTPGTTGTKKTAKEVLDEFGQQVHAQMKTEDTNYIGELKGSLSQAPILGGETTGTTDPCNLKSEYTNLISGSGGGGVTARGDPCKKDTNGNDVDRFSDKQQAEYDNKKIKCSNGGACASFRRLHLCNKSMEKMDTNNNDGKAKHDLLAEVCMAANYEAESLIPYHDKYKLTYGDSQICTVLARSFADIGDIVRGKDLFLGHNQRKKKLEERLQKMFDNIKKNNENLNSLENEQVREYWWEANRETVWEAMTCSEKLDNFSYFHATCGDSTSPSMARDKCRCEKKSGTSGNVNIVPTYFDYVPQYLRWFEEWAEDFSVMDFNKAIKPCKTVSDFDSKRCNANASTEKENGKKIDIVECLIEKLRKEAKKCEENPQTCDKTSTPTSVETPSASGNTLNLVEDVDDDDDIETENTVEAPNICPTPEPERELDEGKCEAAPTAPKAPEPAEESTIQPVPEEEAPAPEVGRDKDIEDKVEVKKEKKPKVSPKPQNPFEIPLSDELLTSMASSTLAWSVGIAFTALSVLQIEFLKGDSEEKSAQDNQNSLDSEEIQHLKQIKKILDDEKQKNQEAGADGSGTGGSTDGKKKTLMDELIDYEQKIATKCIEKRKQDCKLPEDKSAARSLPPPRPASEDGNVENDEDDDGEEEEDEVEEEEEQPEPAKDTTEELPEVKKEEVKVCETVAEALKGNFETVAEALKGNLDDACTQKYGSKSHVGWKCVPTTSGGDNNTREGSESERPPRRVRSADSGKPTGSNSGAICVPPRRRRLYVGKLEQWASPSGNTVVSVQTTPAPSSNLRDDGLRNAFIQSAAIETFFLWDRYKKIKAKEEEEKEEQARQNGGFGLSGDDKDPKPEDELQNGNIPPDFLRQMFYTLADYKDILFSGSKDEKSGVKDIFSGDKEMSQRERKIKEAIQKFFQNGDSQTPSDKDPNEKREQFWKKHGKDIWQGMVCALTYKENGKTIEKDGAVYNKFFGENNTGKPGPPVTTSGTTSGKYKTQYDYEKVKLEDTSGAKPQTTSPSGDTPTLNNPKLTEFVVRPPYFRYLEEWGQNFCKERKKRLKQIKDDCKQGNKKCSGYGENCDDQLDADPSTDADLKCPRCATSCRSYKKWIERKKIEFTKQSGAYGEQKQNCKEESGGSINGF